MRLLTPEIERLRGAEVSYVAPEPLGRGSSRYFANAIGDSNPLYRDERAAAAVGLDGVICPPTLIFETTQLTGLPPDADGYAGHGWPVVIPGTRKVRGGHSYVWYRDVYPDDVITSRWRLESIAETTTSTGLGMVVLTSSCRYSDAQGALIAEQEETLIYVEIAR
jgi:acyl dehydratase